MQNSQKNRIQYALDAFHSGNISKARRLCAQLLKKKPDNPHAMGLMSDILMHQGDYKAAIEILIKSSVLNPQNAENHFKLGFAYMRLGEHEDALTHFRNATHINQDFGEAYNRLCGTAGQLGKLEEAIQAGEIAVRLLPGSPVAHMNLATAYDAYGHTQLALKHFKEAARLAPAHPVIQCSLGDALSGTADKHAAEKCYRNTIRLQPKFTRPYRQLSRLRKYTLPEDADFKILENLLHDHTIPESDRSHLHFALGKMHEDCGLYNKSFRHLEIANRIENKKHNFDPNAFTKFSSDVISFYTGDVLENRIEIGSPSAVPVFIVGMPRSGSTLLEQIIACHPRAFGAGELYWFGQVEQRVQNILSISDSYPGCVRNLDKKSARSLAGDYLEYLDILSGKDVYERITDKLPGNFMHLGLISLLFPNARIINCRRNPLDTCFSIYSILFPGSMDFSHDLKNIAVVYNQYTRLMQHWSKILPHNILTVDYEDLVQNQEEVSRQLIDFISLPWDDACLDFSRNKNRVRTVSAFQVRKGMYTSAVGRWTHFEKHLEPLFETLDPKILERALATPRPSY